MPVTVSVADTVPGAVKDWLVDYDLEEADDFLIFACPQTKKEPLDTLQTSYKLDTKDVRTGPSSNGFFHSFLNAHNHHHHVRVRADDVWIAIIIQLSNYIRSRPEEFAHLFKHTGQKKLIVFSDSTLLTTNYAEFAATIVEMIRESAVNEEVFDWMAPTFSTTTNTDRTVVSMVLAATMEKFFSLDLVTYCGIPSVTLLGDVADYEALLTKLDFIYALGEEPRRFADLLKPIVSRMILSFSDPGATQQFWGQSIDKHVQRSGQMILTGWLTAFCFWDQDGKCQYDAAWSGKETEKYLTLDGVEYQPLRSEDVTVACCRLPVSCLDRGKDVQLHLFAGTLGITCSRSSGIESNPNFDGNDKHARFDTVMPAQGWFVCKVIPEG